ncbi:MAG TPA: universal stress protein [Burkholderiaceae bacterium]|nr:universal stress protein [Burkholderiaceae bacterium]
MLKILIPVDGSELALDAVQHGLRLVREGLKAEFVLANVQEPASLYEIVVARDPQVLQGVSAGAGAHLLEPAEALCKAAGVGCELEVASGDPAHTLMDIVERYACDAVIMGARGQGAVRSALLGSVSQEMIHACNVPVTVVKHVLPDEGESDLGDEGEV